MKTIQKITLLIILLLPLSLFGQGQFTTIGTDFWLGFNNVGTYYELKFVSTSACTVTLDFTDGSVPQRTIDISGAGVTGYVFNINRDVDGYNEMAAVRNTNGKSNKSVRIRSTAPIGIYAINQQSALTDATAVLPVTNYGTKYIAIDGRTMGSQKYLVIAAEDGTTISINGSSNIALDAGQVYAKSSGIDLTGDVITSNKAVAFFNVSEQLRIPLSSTSYTDQAFEQIPPVASWGKEFLAPVTERSSELVRVVASMDETQVFLGDKEFTINTGKFIDTMIVQPLHIKADKPIGVVTYMVGSSYKGGYGDPAISWVPSIDQHMKSASITPFAPLAIPSTSTQLDQHWGQIVVPTDYKDDTKVNGAPLSGGSWFDGPAGSGLSVYNMPFLKESNGWDKSYTFTNEHGLVLLGYGTGSAESYQYLAASSSRKLDAYFSINDLHYEDANLLVPFDCGTPFNFEAVVEYTMNTSASDGYIRWFIDGVEQVDAKNQKVWTLPYMSGGNHEIELRVTDAYNQVETMRTTLDVECSTGLSPQTSTIFEGESATLTIALGSGTTPVDLIFDISAITGTTASTTDYSFPATVKMVKNTSSVTFTVNTSVNNIINEPDRLLKIKASTSGFSDMTASITIKDKSTVTQRTVSISASPISINELPEGVPNVSTVKIALPAGITTTTPIRINLSYAGGTATLNDDYIINKPEATSYIDIPGNQNEVIFTVSAKEDFIIEGDEAIIINATAPIDYTMQTGASNATITIKDKTFGNLYVKQLSGDAAEPSINGKFWIGFNNENITCTQDITVNYTLSGTAKEGIDYEAMAPYKATIPAGSNGVEVEIKIKENFIVEGNKTVNLEITSID